MTTTITNVRFAEPDAARPGAVRPDAAASGPAASGATVDVEFDTDIIDIRPTQPAATGNASSTTGGDIIDGSNHYLLPGLIDSHVHLGSRERLAAAARAGVTTVVDLGTHPDELIAAQRAKHGVPSIVSAGSAASAPRSLQIAQMGFPAESGVTGPDDAERYLDWRTANGSDLIKIIIEDPATTDVPALDVPTIRALVDGAHRRELLTVAHVVTIAAFARGLDAGVDVLTHAPTDSPLPTQTIERMRAAGTISSPTLIMMRTMADAMFADRADTAFANSLESVASMYAAGIPIIVGTDANETPFAPVQHGESLHDEIALLRQAGLSNADVLRGATSRAADLLRLSDRGRIAKGARADLLLADSDPLADPSALRRPRATWVHGSRVP